MREIDRDESRESETDRGNYLPSRFDGWRGWDFSVSVCITHAHCVSIWRWKYAMLPPSRRDATNQKPISTKHTWRHNERVRVCVCVCRVSSFIYPCTHHRANMLRYKIFSAEPNSCNIMFSEALSLSLNGTCVFQCEPPSAVSSVCASCFSILEMCDLYWAVDILASQTIDFLREKEKEMELRPEHVAVSVNFRSIHSSDPLWRVHTHTHTDQMVKRWWRRGPLMRKVIARTVHAPLADAFAC